MKSRRYSSSPSLAACHDRSESADHGSRSPRQPRSEPAAAPTSSSRGQADRHPNRRPAELSFPTKISARRSRHRRRAARLQAAAGEAVHAEERHQGLPRRAAHAADRLDGPQLRRRLGRPIRRARRAWRARACRCSPKAPRSSTRSRTPKRSPTSRRTSARTRVRLAGRSARVADEAPRRDVRAVRRHAAHAGPARSRLRSHEEAPHRGVRQSRSRRPRSPAASTARSCTARSIRSAA